MSGWSVDTVGSESLKGAMEANSLIASEIFSVILAASNRIEAIEATGTTSTRAAPSHMFVRRSKFRSSAAAFNFSMYAEVFDLFITLKSDAISFKALPHSKLTFVHDSANLLRISIGACKNKKNITYLVPWTGNVVIVSSAVNGIDIVLGSQIVGCC